jgi:hypothetical protein
MESAEPFVEFPGLRVIETAFVILLCDILFIEFDIIRTLLTPAWDNCTISVHHAEMELLIASKVI